MKEYRIKYKDRSFIVNAENERHAASKVVKAVKDSANVNDERLFPMTYNVQRENDNNIDYLSPEIVDALKRSLEIRLGVDIDLDKLKNYISKLPVKSNGKKEINTQEVLKNCIINHIKDVSYGYDADDTVTKSGATTYYYYDESDRYHYLNKAISNNEYVISYGQDLDRSEKVSNGKGDVWYFTLKDSKTIKDANINPIKVISQKRGKDGVLYSIVHAKKQSDGKEVYVVTSADVTIPGYALSGTVLYNLPEAQKYLKIYTDSSIKDKNIVFKGVKLEFVEGSHRGMPINQLVSVDKMSNWLVQQDAQIQELKKRNQWSGGYDKAYVDYIFEVDGKPYRYHGVRKDLGDGEQYVRLTNDELNYIKNQIKNYKGELKVGDKSIKDRDFRVDKKIKEVKDKGKTYYIYYGSYSDNPNRKVYLFTGDSSYPPEGSGTVLNSEQEVNEFINKFTDKLIESPSKEALGKNIATEIKAGKDPKQAAAIAYSVKRENDAKIKDADTRSINQLLKKNGFQQATKTRDIPKYGTGRSQNIIIGYTKGWQNGFISDTYGSAVKVAYLDNKGMSDNSKQSQILKLLLDSGYSAEPYGTGLWVKDKAINDTDINKMKKKAEQLKAKLKKEKAHSRENWGQNERKELYNLFDYDNYSESSRIMNDFDDWLDSRTPGKIGDTNELINLKKQLEDLDAEWDRLDNAGQSTVGITKKMEEIREKIELLENMPAKTVQDKSFTIKYKDRLYKVMAKDEETAINKLSNIVDTNEIVKEEIEDSAIEDSDIDAAKDITVETPTEPIKTEEKIITPEPDKTPLEVKSESEKPITDSKPKVGLIDSIVTAALDKMGL